MAHDHPATDRKAVLREAIAACQKVVDRWQRDADELGARHERRTSPLLVRAGAAECVSVLTGLLNDRLPCERCGVEPRWDIFTLCRGCHADWSRERQEEITA
jgi:hypothetical protein